MKHFNIVTGILFCLMLMGCGNKEAMAGTEDAANDLEVVVHAGDTAVLRAPLDEDAVYAIIDGEPRALKEGETLASLGDEALPSRHDVNIITIRDGRVFVSESNCANQVCVGMGSIDSDAYDFPIVCLPHQLIVMVE